MLVEGLVLFQFSIGGRPLNYSQLAVDQATGEVRWQMSEDSRDLFVGDFLYLSKGKIDALDPGTGTTKWSREDERRIRAIVGDDLLVASGSELAAIDASTGEERWRMDTGTVIHAVPVRSGSLLFFPTRKETYFGAPSKERHLFAVDAETGPPGG